jgi:OOP family OmpA-OmpF porin
MKTRLLAALPALGFALLPAHALAAPEGDAAPESAEEAPKPKDRGDQPWIKRWAPERNVVEVGVFGGIFLPHPRLELYEATFDIENQGYKPLENELSPEVGGRIAYYPSRFLGLEFEGAVMPNEVDPGLQATVYALRGHLVAHLIPRSITPFLLVGGGGLGVASRREAIGSEMDAAAHFGGGLKFFVDRQTTLRIEARDTISARRGLDAGVVHSVDVLFGVSLALGRKKEPAPAPILDSDGDGILDPDDKCVDVPGAPEYDGCPIPDTDGDGILDPDDKCVDEPGVKEFEGCPIPDTDGDGILDPDDKCIDVPGVDAYEGCPIPDTDGDGILDTDDKCIDDPETTNGFEDDDGCPDEIPKELEVFEGVIEGIYFDTGKATIKDKSRTKLDEAVAVLQKYPNVRLEVSGHTDDRGSDDSNQDLSQRRADAVKQYFIEHGIGADRIETRGAGETQPIESNKTRKGRAKNRRIEFHVLQ